VSNYNEQFLKQNPLAVLGVLRDLKSQQVPLRISWSGGQFISKVLAVSPNELVMDFGSQEYENQAVQRASQISIIAETQGAKVEFTLPQLKKVSISNCQRLFHPCRLPCGLFSVGNISASALRSILPIAARQKCRTTALCAFAYSICRLAVWAGC